MQISALLLVYLAGNFAHARTVKIGLLIQKGRCCSYQSFESSVGAVSIAMDALKDDGIWSENMR